MESFASVNDGLWQSKTMELPTKVMAEEAACEDLERFAISGDP